MTRYLRAANVKDGSLDLADVATMNFTPKEQTVFSLHPGDVLVSEGSGSLSSVGASAVWRAELDGVVCFQNTLLRMRPRNGVADGRFLEWWARSAFDSGLFASIASGANIYHMSAERARALGLMLPPLDEQRCIADFLDVETSRISAVVEKRQQQVAMIRERMRASLDCMMCGSICSRGVRLSRLTDPARPIQYGIVLPGPDYPGGVPVIKGGDLAGDRLSLDLIKHTDPAIDAQYSRSRVIEGDLVIAIRGSVGEVARVPSELTGANLTQDSARIAPYDVDPNWLALALITSTVQGRIKAMVTGAAITGINIGDLRRVMIPRPTIQAQVELGRRGTRLMSLAEGTTSAVSLSVKLLRERRQALITAAVTGQIDVTTARGADV